MEINEMLQDKKVLAGIAVVAIILIIGIAFVFMGGNGNKEKTHVNTGEKTQTKEKNQTKEKKENTTEEMKKTETKPAEIKVETEIIGKKEIPLDANPVSVEYAGGYNLKILNCVKNGDVILATNATNTIFGNQLKAILIKNGKVYFAFKNGKVYVDNKAKIDGKLNCKNTNENLAEIIKNAEELTPKVLLG